MSQDRQLQLVTSVMITAGFDVSERFSIRPRSFDLIARNNGTLLIIKVVSHIDSISEEVAFDLEVISRHLGGVPLVVGERARDAELERGAVYVRYGIYAISPSTLYDYFVEMIPPLVFAIRGGKQTSQYIICTNELAQVFRRDCNLVGQCNQDTVRARRRGRQARANGPRHALRVVRVVDHVHRHVAHERLQPVCVRPEHDGDGVATLEFQQRVQHTYQHRATADSSQLLG